jgi:hypothetical protein
LSRVVRIAARDVVVDIDLNGEQGPRLAVLNYEPDCIYGYAAKIKVQDAALMLNTAHFKACAEPHASQNANVSIGDSTSLPSAGQLLVLNVTYPQAAPARA